MNLRTYAKILGESIEALQGTSRKAAIVRKRQVLSVALMDSAYTSTEIAEMLNRDHSTILHSRTKGRDLLEFNRYKKLYHEIRSYA